MLIKSTSTVLPTASEEQRVFVLCTDGSQASMLAACFLSYLVCDDDRIHVIHVSEYAKKVDKEGFLKPYEKVFQCTNGNVTFSCVESMYSVTVATTILDYSANVGADFIVMGISGYGKQKLGSVSSQVCKGRCNTIIVKDPREFSTGAANVDEGKLSSTS